MMRLCRILAFLVCGVILVSISGCEQNSSSGSPIFFEFKQQPGDKYIYRIHDEVNWTMESHDGKAVSYHRLQDQKSVMRFNSIDSNAVRSLELTFTVTFDSLTTEIPWMRSQDKLVGNCYVFNLKMRPNGEILEVESDDPQLTFYFNSGYRPSQLVFPKEAISVGYSWDHKAEVPVPEGDPAQVTSKYTFEGFERIGEFDCAVIGFEAVIEYKEVISKKEPDEKEEYDYRTYSCRTNNDGKLYFAFREGFVVKKVNLLSSDANHCWVTGEESRIKSRTQMRDAETITLAAIERNDGEKIHFQFE